MITTPDGEPLMTSRVWARGVELGFQIRMLRGLQSVRHGTYTIEIIFGDRFTFWIWFCYVDQKVANSRRRPGCFVDRKLRRYLAAAWYKRTGEIHDNPFLPHLFDR